MHNAHIEHTERLEVFVVTNLTRIRNPYIFQIEPIEVGSNPSDPAYPNPTYGSCHPTIGNKEKTTA